MYRESSDSRRERGQQTAEGDKPGGQLTTGLDAIPTPPYIYNFVHACCEPGSLLCDHNIAGVAVNMIEITNEDDFASPRGISQVVQALRGKDDVLWFSPPCTRKVCLAAIECGQKHGNEGKDQ